MLHRVALGKDKDVELTTKCSCGVTTCVCIYKRSLTPSTDAGVVGGCEQLCQLLEDKVHSQLADVVCNILCDYVGIEEFIKIIEK